MNGATDWRDTHSKQYENYILEIEWKHLAPGGNSGVFILDDGTPYKDKPFPTGMEVQMLGPETYEIRDYNWPCSK